MELLATPSGPRRLRELRVVATGHPAPFTVTAPAYVLAVLAWLAAAIVFTASAEALSSGAIFERGPVFGAHLVGLVVFPFAVAAAVWQLLPVMLRNDPSTRRARPVTLALLAAGIPLAFGIALDLGALVAVSATVLAIGLCLVLAEGVALIRGVPRERTLAVSRPAVALALPHAALAFVLGAVAFADGGPDPLGVPWESFLLIHLTIALVGWLTVLIAAVGRTLVPMLGLAAAAERRTAPLAEGVIVAGLWVYVVGLAIGSGGVVTLGIAVMLAGFSPAARVFLRVAWHGKLGIREGPVAHVAVGLAFVVQAAVLGIAGALGGIDGRTAAIGAVLFLGLGWATGVILGHLGKLVSLSGWGSWPPGPRPKQEALYPRRLWQLEATVFALGVELIAIGVLLESNAVTFAGGVVLIGAALLAAAGVGETLRRVSVARRSG